MRALFPFGLLPKRSKTSLLTLAHASGLMAEALGCDDSSIPNYIPIIPVYLRVTDSPWFSRESRFPRLGSASLPTRRWRIEGGLKV